MLRSYVVRKDMKQTNIDSRINRLIGQIEGIRRMINQKRQCEDIAQQILAARQALSKIGIIVLKEGICNVPHKDTKRVEKLMKTVFRV